MLRSPPHSRTVQWHNFICWPVSTYHPVPHPAHKQLVSYTKLLGNIKVLYKWGFPTKLLITRENHTFTATTVAKGINFAAKWDLLPSEADPSPPGRGSPIWELVSKWIGTWSIYVVIFNVWLDVYLSKPAWMAPSLSKTMFFNTVFAVLMELNLYLFLFQYVFKVWGPHVIKR